ELRAGLDQLVLIGSGYDTRPYRFAKELTGVRTFEVDQNATLETKRRRASRRGYDLNSVTYVAVDLSSKRPLDALPDCGYDGKARTLFVCSGILMYLDAQAVDQVFTFIRDSEADNSVCFDYVYEAALGDSTSYYGAERMIRNVQKAGEPYRFGIDEADVGEFLVAHGFRLISNLDPLALGQNYLVRSDGSQRGRICGFLGIAHAGLSQ
ncbi:hypothetical protein LCGC14_2760370, partial [marine sediment metagenome]